VVLRGLRFCDCFFFSSRRRHTRFSRDWSSDVCSSDLMAWSRVGVQTMARLRVWQANGGSARAAYLHGKPQPPLKVSSRWLQRLREEVETGRLLPAETLGNPPALRGHRTPLTRALRALSQLTAV